MNADRPITVSEVFQLGLAWAMSFPVYFIGEYFGGFIYLFLSELFPSREIGGLLVFFLIGGPIAVFVSPVECGLWKRFLWGFFYIVDVYRIGPISVWFIAGLSIMWFN